MTIKGMDQKYSKADFEVISEFDVARPYENIHGGDGTISVRYFKFDKAPAPANFLVYDMPPGTSEGIHIHLLCEGSTGPYDEYYYIVQGEGEMVVEGEIVRIKAGDHIHTPLGIAHGVRNTQPDQHLKIFLTYIRRSHRLERQED